MRHQLRFQHEHFQISSHCLENFLVQDQSARSFYLCFTFLYIHEFVSCSVFNCVSVSVQFKYVCLSLFCLHLCVCLCLASICVSVSVLSSSMCLFLCEGTDVWQAFHLKRPTFFDTSSCFVLLVAINLRFRVLEMTTKVFLVPKDPSVLSNLGYAFFPTTMTTTTKSSTAMPITTTTPTAPTTTIPASSTTTTATSMLTTTATTTRVNVARNCRQSFCRCVFKVTRDAAKLMHPRIGSPVKYRTCKLQSFFFKRKVAVADDLQIRGPRVQILHEAGPFFFL